MIYEKIVDSIEEYRLTEHSSDPANMEKLFMIQQKLCCDRVLLADEIHQAKLRIATANYKTVQAKKQAGEESADMPKYKIAEAAKYATAALKREEAQERAILDHLIRIYDASGDVMRAIQQQLAFLRQEWQYNTFNR